MADLDKSLRSSRIRLVVGGALILLTLGMPAVFSRLGTAPFPLYRNLTKHLMWALSTLTGLVPVALWDLTALALIVLALVTLVVTLVRRKPLLPWVSAVGLTIGIFGFLFVDCWALNHYAPSLAQELGLEVGERSVDDLAEATERYLVDAAMLAPEVARDGDGALERPDFSELARVAGASYAPLASTYEVFRGSTAPVKALLAMGPVLLSNRYSGIFMPITGEAGVPLACPVADMPYVMCHETAHRLGIASEQEANFAAYVACMASDDVRLRYSGAYNAFGWCLNALSKESPERARQIVSEVASRPGMGEGVALVLADRADTRAQYDALEGPVSDVGDAVNEVYLTSMGESSGVKSYGLVVDYLIAWNESGRTV